MLFHGSLIVQCKGECACVGEVGKKENAMRQCVSCSFASRFLLLVLLVSLFLSLSPGANEKAVLDSQ